MRLLSEKGWRSISFCLIAPSCCQQEELRIVEDHARLAFWMSSSDTRSLKKVLSWPWDGAFAFPKMPPAAPAQLPADFSSKKDF